MIICFYFCTTLGRNEFISSNFVSCVVSERERHKFYTVTLVELVLEFDLVEPEGMENCRE